MKPRVSMAVALALVGLAAWADEADEAASAAREALAAKTGGDPAGMIVERVEPARWPDWSLGCVADPSADAGTVEGYRVFLRAGDKVHVVNVAGAQVRTCFSFRAGSVAEQSAGGSPMNQKPQPEPVDPASQAVIAKARADLQRRVSAPPQEIRLLEFKSVVWPDSSLGCPRPGMVYTQVQRDGVLIRFEAHGRTFEYHGGAGREPFLCESLSG